MDPEAYLRSLEPLGWRLGLERMQRLTSLLGMPQRRFGSVHVVGTNGKSSVTLMVAALLEAHGVAAGAYLSPHTGRWAERLRIRGEEIGDAAFESAVDRTAEAVETVNRSLEEEDAVTQFEAVTAAAFVAFAAAGVGAAAVEAGLGGRLDATNVIPSKVTVLTSVGLDHTQWLGDTVEAIAAEKLAVLRDHTKLVTGRLEAPMAELARRVAQERSAELVQATEEPPAGLRLCAGGFYQRRNFALALAATEAFLERPLDPGAVEAVAASVTIPGRLELRPGEPPVLLDAAHNPDGARALAESLPEIADGRPVIACVAVLADKDAAGILAALGPACAHIVATEPPAEALVGSGRPGAEPLPAAELARLAQQAGVEAEAVPDAAEAFARARGLARERDGLLVVTGSHYLLGQVR